MATVLNIRALNVLSLLTAYQLELCEDYAQRQSSGPGQHPNDHRPVIQLSHAVQASSKALGTMVLQERARWLNLTNLLDKKRDDILNMPIVTKAIFGSALTSMERCEANKKKDEALQLCLLRKALG